MPEKKEDQVVDPVPDPPSYAVAGLVVGDASSQEEGEHDDEER